MGVLQSDVMAAAVGAHTPSRNRAATFGCGSADDQRAALGWPATDPGKAAELLRASGCDGRPIPVMDPADNATLHPAALMTVQTLKRIGANVDLVAMDWSALVQRRSSRAAPGQGRWNLRRSAWCG